jgi:hypothetical protein
MPIIYGTVTVNDRSYPFVSRIQEVTHVLVDGQEVPLTQLIDNVKPDKVELKTNDRVVILRLNTRTLPVEEGIKFIRNPDLVNAILRDVKILREQMST